MALDDDDLETDKKTSKFGLEDGDETETDRLLDQLERKMRKDKESLSQLVDSLSAEDGDEEDENAEGQEYEDGDEPEDGQEGEYGKDDIPPPPIPSSLRAERSKDDEFFNYKEFKNRMSESSKLNRFVDKDKEKHKAVGMVIGGLIGVVIAIAAFVFFVVKLSDSGSDGAVAVKRDESPIKVRPASPGGMEIAGTDKRVYERLTPGEASREAVRTVAPDMPVRPAQTDQIGALVERVGEQDMAQADGPVFEEDQTPAIYTPRKLREASPPQPQQQVSRPASRTGGAASSGGIWKVQLIALKSDAAARKSWQDLVARVPELNDYAPEVMRVDLPDKGTVFRLRATGFDSRAAAVDFCESLKRRGGSCFVVK